MPSRDGDGWIECSCGSRHWGLHGAAGVAVIHPNSGTILLQQRAPWTHGGSTWALPGGAIDSHEDPVMAALRELNEELSIDGQIVRIVGNENLFDHGHWKYHTVLATVSQIVAVQHNEESIDIAWVPFADVPTYELHPSFASTWVLLEKWIDTVVRQWEQV